MTAPEEAAPYHHGHLRVELLERARVVLGERGVEGLSLRELARDLGVSSTAPRRHFRDKAALLDALALAGFNELDSRYAGHLQADDFESDFTVLAREYLSFAVEHAELLELMFARKYGDPQIAEALQRMMTRVVDLVERAQARGEVHAGNPGEIASASFAPVLGLVTSVRSGLVAPEDVGSVLASTVDIAVQGLRP